jgi:amino acid adenylation domain-containing protein
MTARPALDGCLHEAFEDRARELPDRIAVVDGSRTLTYRELDAAADRIAARLRRLGAGPGTLVGLCAGRSAELVAGMIAILKSGAGYLPLDPSYPAARLSYLLADSRCSLVLGQRGHSAFIDDTTARFADLDLVITDGPEEDRAAGHRRADTGDVAYVIYTSGSTGAPKGVVVPHAQVMTLFAASRDSLGLSHADTWTLFHSFAFDFSVWEIWGALLTGGRLVIVPYTTSRSPGSFLDLLRQQRVTVLNQTPSAFYQLLEAAAEQDFPPTSLRLVIFGGEALDPAHLAPWFKGYGDAAPRLLNMYGITETTVHVTIRDITAADSPVVGSPIGRPLPHLRVHVLDARMRPTPTGTVGEMYVGGDGVSRGYLNRPGLTAGRFVPDPFGGRGARLYRTGDLAVADDRGELEFRGRIDDQVQLRGFRIELGEVESTISGLPGISGCAVVVQGAGVDAQLAAFVVGDYGPAAGLRTELARHLPPHMIPSRIVRVASIPLTPNGKADRERLRGWAATGRPDGLCYSPPANAAEEAVARIWGEVLGIGPVGRTDSFLALGGNSLQATRVAARISRELGGAPSTARLFRAETVADVVASLPDGPGPQTAGFPATAPAAGTAEPAGPDVPASFSQQRLVFLTDLNRSVGPAYNLPAAVRVIGPLDRAALTEALGDVLARHDALRTALVSTPEGVVADIRTDCEIPLRHADVSQATDPEQAAREAAARAARAPFDLAKAPLLRAVLIRLAPDDHLLVVVVHHAVADGWSLAILGDDLAGCYRARTGRGDPVPPAATGFADFARGQLQADRMGRFEAGLDFWRQTLQGAPAALELPADMSRPDMPAHRGARVARQLPRPLHAALLRFAAAERVTLYPVLLAAAALQVHRLTGARDLVIGSPAASRPDPRFESVVGFFVNTLPIRVRIGHGATYRSVVGLAHEAILQALDHQDVPFERIVAALAPERRVSRQPLVQVVVADQGGWRFHPRLAGTTTRPAEVDNGTSKFDLLVEIAEDADGVRLAVEYDTELFLPSTAERFLEGLLGILGAGLAAPAAPWPLTAPDRAPDHAPAAAAGPSPDPDDAAGGEQALSGTAERTLTEIWSEVLGVTSIGPAENFFALGGDSIRALRVAAGARARGLPIGVEQVFREPTVAGLAALCAPGGRAEPAPRHADIDAGAGTPAGVADIYRATALQLGLIFQTTLSDDATLYHDLVSVRLAGPLDATLLQRSVDILVARHEILRTTFDLAGYDEPMQLVRESMVVAVRVEEAGQPGGDAVRRWWRRAWREPFDLSAGPLLRCTVLRCPDGTYHLALSAHHAVLDGWSFSLLLTELLQEYDAMLSGAPLTPPRPPVRYREFVALERQAAEDLAASRFWQAAAAGRVPGWPTADPAELPGEPPLDPDYHAILPDELVSRARQLAGRVGVPVKSVCLGAHLKALAELSGDQEAVTGLVVNGRPEVDGADRALGLFLNSVPIRARPGTQGGAELSAMAFAAERRALRYRRFPLASIQRLTEGPCFRVLFNYADFYSFDPLAGLSALRIEDWWFCDRTEVPLVVELLRRPLSDAMELNIRVNPESASRVTAARFAMHLRRALAEMTADRPG